MNKNEKNKCNDEKKDMHKEEEKDIETNESNEEDNEYNTEAEKEKLKGELEKQKDIFIRLSAEYENYRKRSEREKLSIYSDAIISTVKILLPLVDSLDLAIKSQENAPEEYKKGLELIKMQQQEAFKQLNITETGEKGELFNPQYHNAIAHEKLDDVKDNTIIEVFQKGYLLKDKVIREAMVKVAN